MTAAPSAAEAAGYSGTHFDRTVGARDGLGLGMLSFAHACVGRWHRNERVMRALRLRQLGRAWLARKVVARERCRADDVTVVLGVRNRMDYRIGNALSSIRAQRGLPGALRIVVVDYTSEPPTGRRLRELCGLHEADYVRVDDAPRWSRSRCLNVGVRRTTTKFLMTSDVDVLLSPDYLADAIGTLRAAPLSVVCSAMLDLPERSAGSMQRIAETGAALDLARWKRVCTPRLGWPMHPSIIVTFTAFLQLIRGYDEYYELWGREDADLMRRLDYLGLQPRTPGAGSFYLHQWHPKYEGIPAEAHAGQLRRNTLYMGRAHSIVRNGPHWGGARPRTAAKA
jgi:hypothetical protein